MPDPKEIEVLNGLRLFSLSAALIACSPRYFAQNPTDMRTALSQVKDVSETLSFLLKGGHSTIAGRLAGAFRNIGRNNIADEILKTMMSAGFDVRENDPFEEQPRIRILNRERSPSINRMRILWQEMRPIVLAYFPNSPRKKMKYDSYLKDVKEIYLQDAYHSLSIEGYRVNPELIQRVRNGIWDSEHSINDKEQVAALAARGYWEAYNKVTNSVSKVLKGMNPGKIFKEDHKDWYHAMFAPSVNAGILKPADLAGYRHAPVYIPNSMHVPPNYNAVRDLMPAFCDLLIKETEPAVRVVLGHFFFVYIHPYMDGNGRLGRFLMNVMLAGGGFPWIVVPVEERSRYISSLEEASVKQNIKPFTKFIADLIAERLSPN